MQTTEEFTTVADAAARLGYRNRQHFRENVLPKFGLRPVKVRGRWMLLLREFDAVVDRLVRGAITPTPAAE